ncbi:MAG: NAD(P)-binding domain-containing protein [Anaerolineae bacterium]|nr:NAD(P)-binding domain-containing protein [Anaerolineae bacterium]
MRIGILGTGTVGQIIGAKLVSLGHDVVLGTRDVAKLMEHKETRMGQTQSFAEWHKQNSQVKLGTFAQSASHGEILFNCTAGAGSLEALRMAGEANLKGKILIDIANPLDFSRGMPPSLTVSNTDSLGEQIQRAFPAVKVVKTLNTVNANVMVNPRQVADGDHHIFVCGNDAAAKAQVTDILKNWFGWRHVLDLGDIKAARAIEMYLPLWVGLFMAQGTPLFNIKIVS